MHSFNFVSSVVLLFATLSLSHATARTPLIVEYPPKGPNDIKQSKLFLKVQILDNKKAAKLFRHITGKYSAPKSREVYRLYEKGRDHCRGTISYQYEADKAGAKAKVFHSNFVCNIGGKGYFREEAKKRFELMKEVGSLKEHKDTVYGKHITCTYKKESPGDSDTSPTGFSCEQYITPQGESLGTLSFD